MQTLVIILTLVVLEGFLSFDNALALASMVRHLPKSLQKKALTYGIAGAFFFRFISLTILSFLMQSTWSRLVGGFYLIWLAIAHFAQNEESRDFGESKIHYFWRTVVLIELTDIAFSLDSILASIALSSQFWIVFTGGCLGIIMMRFTAKLFIGLIDKYPRLESTAYLLVLIVGSKLVLEGLGLSEFENKSDPAFWVFWVSMAVSMIYGFTERRKLSAV